MKQRLLQTVSPIEYPKNFVLREFIFQPPTTIPYGEFLSTSTPSILFINSKFSPKEYPKTITAPTSLKKSQVIERHLISQPDLHTPNVDFPPSHSTPIPFLQEPTLFNLDINSFVDKSLTSTDLFMKLHIGRLRGKKYIQEDFKNAFEETKVATKEKTKKLSDEKSFRKEIPLDKFVSGHSFNDKNTNISFFDLIKPLLMPPLETLENQSDLFLPPGKKPYPFQVIGIEKLIKNPQYLLADEMGTGKTVMATLAMRILFQRKKIKKTLILCPVSLIRVWKDHIEDWGFGELITVVAHGQKSQRKISWRSPAHVFITSYDTFRSDIQNANIPDDKKNFDLLIMDEAQYVKNTSSSRHKAIKKINPRIKWAITGTPLENDINDVKAIFSILKPKYIHAEENNPQRIQALIKPLMLRRLKKDVLKDLPPKTHQIIWLSLNQEQRKQYNYIKNFESQKLRKLHEENRITRQHIFSVITKLKQICNFPQDSLTSPKSDTTVDMIEEIASSGNKVIIFSQFIKEGINKLEAIFKPYGVTKLTGDMSPGKRELALEEFKNNPKIPIILMSLKAGGVGLTLTEANYVVHFDQWWNPAIMRQAEDRAHRSGQDKPVTIYELWMENTIEERIYSILQRKKHLAAQVIDSIAEDTPLEELNITTDEWLHQVLEIYPEDKSLEIINTFTKEEHSTQAEEYLKVRNKLYHIDPTQFEQVVAAVFKHWGYPNVIHTGQPSDEGIDVYAERYTSEGKEIAIIQCKRYQNNVSVNQIRELAGAISNMSANVKGYLVTTSDFTNHGKIFAAKSKGKIELINGMELTRLILQFDLEFLL
ncbi:MAG: restriction endonuclease [Anaerolineales bacterium]|nr:restriction endonuclease [Anaerolineales bacterium]